MDRRQGLQYKHTIICTTHAPFKCSKCGSAKVAAIEDKGHRSKHKHTIICTTHAPFKCSKKCGSAKVAAIEDKGHGSNTSTQ